MSEHPLSKGSEVWRLAGLGEHGLSYQKTLPSKAGCSLGSVAGAGGLSTTQIRARLGSDSAAELGSVFVHRPFHRGLCFAGFFFPLIPESDWQGAGR